MREPFGDGMAVRIDGSTVYEPDASVRCGPRLPNEDVQFADPVIVVEVISLSSYLVERKVRVAR